MAQRHHAPTVRETTKTVKGKTYLYHQLTHYEGGRRIRTFYPDAAAASKALQDILDKQALNAERQAVMAGRIGRKAKKLTDSDLFDAVKGLEILGRCATLAKAAEFYMAHNHPKGGTRTAEEIVADYRESRVSAGRRDGTIRDIVQRLGKFATHFKGVPISHITTTDLETWLDSVGGGPVNRNQCRVHAVGLFNYAIGRHYVTENPAAVILTQQIKRTQPHVLSVADCNTLMRKTEELHPEMIPFMGLCIFAGIRPEGEAQRLNWKDIDLTRGEAFIRPEVSKTHDERWVKLQPNLVAWLLSHRKAAGPIHFSRRAYDQIREKAGIVGWKNDCMRHTFCSYHLAAFDNAGQTAEQAGHRVIGTLFKHYRRAVRKEDAEAFWQIRPESTGRR